MDDVEDGIEYIIQQGWADKNKIMIYGVKPRWLCSIEG